MKLRNIWVVYRKELLDLLRDRRTLIGTFLWPLVLFPLMTVGFGQIEKKVSQKAAKREASIMLLGGEHAPELAAKLRETEGLALVPTADDSVLQINNKKLQAAVEFPAGFQEKILNGVEPPKVSIYFYDTEGRSERAVDRIGKTVDQYRAEVVERRLGARGLMTGLLKPVDVRAENVASAEKVGGIMLGMLLPYFIILLCLMSALQPAIDLTAGEKERGTMETILASSVGRIELVLGKFLLVLSFSVFNTILSISSFAVTMGFAKDYAAEMTLGHAYTINPKAMLLVFLIVLPLAVLFSAALLTIALFAKSFKEAQSYTGYVMLAAIFPALISILPGIDLNAGLALVPIINVSLVARELFTGSFPWGLMGLVFASTTVYAAAALWVAVKMFQRESVLFRA